jgi:hypothetical protein
MEADQASDDHIALTKVVRASLRAEHKRTDVTAMQLLDGAEDLPDGLTAGSVNRWMNGLIRAAPRCHYDYVVARWKALPDATATQKRGKRYPTASDAWIEVTDAMSSHLRLELARTGLDHAVMFEGLIDVPPGLNARIVKGWLYEEAETTRTAHWKYVVARLAAMPDFIGPLPPLTRKRDRARSMTHSSEKFGHLVRNGTI